MDLLLDTHAWLWFTLGDVRLSGTAKAAILNPSNVKFISPASFWEISIKIRLGKYVLAAPYKSFMQQAIVGNGFQYLPITPDHTALVSTLPYPHGNEHRDPFDRLLIAQAMVERMSIVTDDGRFGGYGVPVIW